MKLSFSPFLFSLFDVLYVTLTGLFVTSSKMVKTSLAVNGVERWWIPIQSSLRISLVAFMISLSVVLSSFLVIMTRVTMNPSSTYEKISSLKTNLNKYYSTYFWSVVCFALTRLTSPIFRNKIFTSCAFLCKHEAFLLYFDYHTYTFTSNLILNKRLYFVWDVQLVEQIRISDGWNIGRFGNQFHRWFSLKTNKSNQTLCQINTYHPMRHGEIFNWNPLVNISLKDFVVFINCVVPEYNVKSVVCISHQNPRSSNGSIVWFLYRKNVANLQ